MQDQFECRLAEDETVAEVTLGRAFQEQNVLLPDWPVEPQAGDGGFDVGLVCVGADQHVNRVAYDIDTEEDDHRH